MDEALFFVVIDGCLVGIGCVATHLVTAIVNVRRRGIGGGVPLVERAGLFAGWRCRGR